MTELQSKNPYTAGNPVGNQSSFIGREDILKRVLTMLRNPNDSALILYGQRRIGKTSFLQFLQTRLPQEGNFLPVYFDLEFRTREPLDSLLKNLASAIAEKLDLRLPDFSTVDVEQFFRSEWLPQVLHQLPQGQKLVILLDEFDVMDSKDAAQAFFPYLRELFDLNRERLRFLIVLGRNFEDLTSSWTQAVLRGSEREKIGLLPQADAETLIRIVEQVSPLRWQPEAVERVWQLTHGHPFLIQALCKKIYDAAEAQAAWSITPEAVDQAVKPAIEAHGHALDWLWTGLKSEQRVMLAGCPANFSVLAARKIITATQVG